MIKRLTVASVVMLFAFGAIAQVPVPYITGFEASDGFIAGQTINGVDGWAVVSEGTPDAKVTNAVAQSGTLSVALEANCTIDKKLTAVGKTKVWMEGYFRGSGTTAAPSFPATPAASACWSAWYDERTSGPTAACEKPIFTASASNMRNVSGCT